MDDEGLCVHCDSEEIMVETQALFTFNENGVVDLVEGVEVTDAVTAFWEAIQDVVREAWAESPLAQEKARVQVLSAFLDRVRPGWRDEIAWATR